MKTIEREYPYVGEDNVPVGRVVRYVGKSFAQHAADGLGGYLPNLNGIELPIYRLSEVVNADISQIVYGAEGEKDVDALVTIGAIATCNSGGVKKWGQRHSKYLAGRRVAVIPDNDAAGEAHALQVATDLIGQASSVKTLHLPGLAHKGDVSDWIAAGGTIAELERLYEECPEFNAAQLYPPVDPELRDLMDAFVTPRQLMVNLPDEIPYILEPLVLPGAITDIVGSPKEGKTTLMVSIVKCMVNGEEFLGKPSKKVGVVILTEQTVDTFRVALDRGNLLDSDNVRILAAADSRGHRWPEIVEAAIGVALEINAKVLVVDTLADLAGLRGNEENDAGNALEIMEPLRHATDRGLAVIVVRHKRKGGGRTVDAGRGSSQLAGSMDIMLTLDPCDSRGNENVRRLSLVSRVATQSSTRYIELTSLGYVDRGPEPGFRQRESEIQILDLIPFAESQALTSVDIVNLLGEEATSRTSVDRVLASLSDSGILARSGTGRKGNPYRYWRSKSHVDDSQLSFVPVRDIE